MSLILLSYSLLLDNTMFLRFQKSLLFLSLAIIAFSHIAHATNISDSLQTEQTESLLDASDSIVELEQAAHLGDTQSMIKLGLLYFQGKQLQKNDRKAIQYLWQATDAGDADAPYMLAQVYLQESLDKYTGKDANPSEYASDNDKIMHYSELAANRGNINAMMFVATVYKYGNMGVKKDLQKSHTYYSKLIEYYRPMADQGDLRALYTIAITYEVHLEDKNKAQEYYQLIKNLEWKYLLAHTPSIK